VDLAISSVQSLSKPAAQDKGCDAVGNPVALFDR
jgi:hypothetical protein